MVNTWIIKIKNGVKMVICPHCGYKADYPDAFCNGCDKKLEAPDETMLIKKEWW